MADALDEVLFRILPVYSAMAVPDTAIRINQPVRRVTCPCGNHRLETRLRMVFTNWKESCHSCSCQ